MLGATALFFGLASQTFHYWPPIALIVAISVNSIPLMNSFILLLAQNNADSLRITLLVSLGILLISAGIASFMIAFRVEAKARKTIQKTQPAVKETIKERDTVYIRCKYCGTKVPDKETKCPECGAKL